MTIKKNGWFAWIVFRTLADKDIPTQMSLCRLFWRSVAMVFVFWPIVGGLGLIMLAVLYTLLYTVNFLFGRRPVFDSDNVPKEQITVPYKRWLKVKGVRVTPALALLPLTALVGVRPEMYEGEHYFKRMSLPVVHGVRMVPMVAVASLFVFAVIVVGLYSLAEKAASVAGSYGTELVYGSLGFLALAVVTWAAVKFFSSEAWALLREYVKARKENFCPIVTIE